ncbi:MAG: acyl-CoA thioesterase [Bacteroidota bacterium]|jgi:acyl-CoA thioester hydrolase|nr:acyl-CoA thioesterase [Sphingobacteriales bacterium]
MELNTTFYETELQVRPDDIDMFQHVHSTRYLDYVLAARYDQMERCYGNPMHVYLEKGLGWVANSCFIEFKRALKLGDTMCVRTRIIEVRKNDVKVEFEILNRKSDKLCCNGYFYFTLVELQNGRAVAIPDWVQGLYVKNK